MDTRTFTEEEFYNFIFVSKEPLVPVVINEEVKKYINISCIKIGSYKNFKPAQWAARNGYLEIVKYLVNKGANITADNNLAVRRAAVHGYLDVVKYLVNKGANITANDNTAVRWAAHKGHLETVKYLAEKGADITACDNLTVRCPARYGHLETVKYLLSTYIYSEEDIHRYAREFTLTPEIKELLANYRQFSYTKASTLLIHISITT